MIGKTAIIVDAACDLPADYIANNHIFVIPFHIVTIAGMMLDVRNPERTQKMYSTHLLDQSEDFAHTEPFSTQEIEQFVLTHIACNYDQAIAITMSSSRSEAFNYFKNACFGIATKSFKQRREKGLKGGFSIEVIDSKSLGPGSALLVYEAIEHLKLNNSVIDTKKHIESLVQSVYVYGLPNDLLYMYTRAKAKNENRITWGKYTLATMLGVKPLILMHNGETQPVARVRSVFEGLEKAIEHIIHKPSNEFKINAVCVSYAGDLSDIKQLDTYNNLAKYCNAIGLNLFVSQMGLTIAINLGSKALLIGFSASSSSLGDS